ncbi:protein lethal(2)essential for life [Cephus cinctus]|uniref:Protein lethal(2)essential for life n=1 Tax=Cephus cinctus TaxID=211228 RepID=A0AAJ7FUZ7_CEPCN|nr:protein lethal(2)essential for life [Cephus cinctus]
MSLIPLVFADLLDDDLDRPQYLNPYFGRVLQPSRSSLPRRAELMYYRPWADLLRQGEDGGASTVKANKDQFEVVLDVQQFAPEEINVKVVDKYVVVEAKHEEKQDEHGWVSRQFVRKYLIPEQCDIEQVTSKLSVDGVLTIVAPRKDQQPKAENERTIKIEHTGKPALQKQPTEKKAIKPGQEKKTEKRDK